MQRTKCSSVFFIFTKWLTLNLIALLVWSSEMSIAEAVTPISPGDRVLMLGDQWGRNGTAAQSGFEVIRLSSYEPDSLMKDITNTSNLKLMISLSEGADSTIVPPM